MTPIYLPQEASPEAMEESLLENLAEALEPEEEGDMDPGEMPEGLFGQAAEEPPPPIPERSGPEDALLALEEAVEQVPEDLRKQMAELLRAEFREVIRWKP